MQDFSQMSAAELWSYAERAMRSGRLRDAKNALYEIGLRFDDAYSRLESLVAGKESVLS